MMPNMDPKQMARMMKQITRAQDIVARIGGDEFAILVEGLRSVAVVVTALAIGLVHILLRDGKADLEYLAANGYAVVPLAEVVASALV